MITKFVLWTVLTVTSLSISSGASFTYNLTCVLNGLDSHACVSGPSFGTVTITDAGVNQVGLSVDLLNSALKFRDLMLNFTGGVAFTDILSSDGKNLTLSPDGFSLNPYSGAFDVGVTGGQGWTGDSPYSTTLSGVGGTLTASMLNGLDSAGKISVALHIQSLGPGSCTGSSDGTTPCTPGTAGNGSLKIGGILSDGGIQTDSTAPEPSSAMLIGLGLAGLGLLSRKRRVY
jgi:hypothetical protein